ncbi:MAG: hypothetical protein ABIH41_03115, partial [Nanoarchaeota archaeon]
LLLALVIGAVALYWSRFPVVIEPLLRFGDWNFVEWSLSWRSLSFALLLIPFAAVTFVKEISTLRKATLLLLAFVSVVPLVLHITSAHLLLLDIAIIIAAAACIKNITSAHSALDVLVSVAIIAASLVLVFALALRVEPAVSQEKLDSIASIAVLTEPGAHILVPVDADVPWVLGYSGRRIIASERSQLNRWTFQEWWMFRNGLMRDQADLLKRYQKPLYIYQSEPIVQENLCFRKVTQSLYRFAC